MSSSDLISLINSLKEETKNYYNLVQKNSKEKIPQKRQIKNKEIEESKNKINIINQYINKNIKYYQELLKIKKEISEQKQIKNNLEKKSEKIDEFIKKGKKIIINNIPYYENLPEYANKKIKSAELSPLDLINLTLRLSQQKKAPPIDLNTYLNNNNTLIDEKQNDFNLFSFYIKNKNRYLYPYPTDFELKNSILRYDFSEENRLLPPIYEFQKDDKLDNEGNIITNKGSQIKIKYPLEKLSKDVYFKYSKDPNIIPSMFSGIKYNDYFPPRLDKDCTFKVCSCKNGFKDSKIVTFKFIINNDIEMAYYEKKVMKEAKKDIIVKEHNVIDADSSLVFKNQYSNPSINSPQHNDQGTSSYRASFLNIEDMEDNEDEDEI